MRVTFFFVLIFTFLACNQSETKKETPVVNKTIKKEKKISKNQAKEEIRLDTIDNKNTVAFLKAYGKLNPETTVLIETKLGNITIELDNRTPLHRANFIFLTKTGYFNYTCFHRVVKGFIIQGGNSDHPEVQKRHMMYKSYRLPNEIQAYQKHNYGSLAAAREWDDNPKKLSSGFEFYVIQQKNGSHHLDGEHTIFGKVISGMKVVDKIAQLETDSKEWPISDVYIKATVIK